MRLQLTLDIDLAIPSGRQRMRETMDFLEAVPATGISVLPDGPPVSSEVEGRVAASREVEAPVMAGVVSALGEADAPEPGPVIVPVIEPGPGVVEDVPDTAPEAFAEREDAAAPDWTGAEDVVILEGIGSGQQAHRIARALPGRRAPEIVARFRALVPVRTPDAIERALSDARTR